MWNDRLNEAVAGIKIAGRNINNLRYADDTTLMAETKDELKSLLMKVKEESESESRSLMSDSLRLCELYSPWNFLGQNTGVCSLSLLQGIFPTQGHISCNAGRFFTSWAKREAQSMKGPEQN